MNPKEISAFLAPPTLTAKETLLLFTGAAITLLVVASGTSFYNHDYRHGIWCFLVAIVLGLVFFRKRKTALVVSGLCCLSVLGSLGFPFHPSVAAFLLLVGCYAALYFWARWSHRKYPYLSFRQMHTVFEGEAAMAAENARIEAQARELVKKRPFGPWLFR